MVWHCLALFGTVWYFLPKATIDLRVISEGHLRSYLRGHMEPLREVPHQRSGPRKARGLEWVGVGPEYPVGWALAIPTRYTHPVYTHHPGYTPPLYCLGEGCTGDPDLNA